MRTAVVLFAIVLSVAAVACGWAVAQERPGSGPKLVRVIPKDRIPAIFRPAYVSADKAQLHDETAVIGLAINGEARAFAISLLDGHEIVNDTIGGTPVAVTW
jgi:hypothetical protein